MSDTALEPNFSLLVKGQAIDDELSALVYEIVVRRHIRLADSFTVRMNDPEESLLDGNDFPFGAKLEIKLGNADKMESVFIGEITAWMAMYSQEGTDFVFRGMDKSHRLRRGARFRSLKATKDKDAPDEVLADYELDPKADDTKAEHTTLQQFGLSDHAFLLDRARRIGYRLGASDGTLNFIKPTYKSSKHTARWQEHIETLDVVVELSDMPTEVTVRGWDSKKKETFSEVVTGDDLLWGQGDATDGPAWSKKLFGKAALTLEDMQPRNATEAKVIAAAYLQGRSEQFVRGPLTIRGTPTLEPGTTITLDRMPEPFDGAYLIQAVTHFYSESGFLTRLELARSGL